MAVGRGTCGVWFASALLVLYSLTANAQSEAPIQISGTVQDSVGEPLLFANVYLQRGDNIVAFTNSGDQGTFLLSLTDTGQFRLNVSALGYQKFVKPLHVTAAGLIQIPIVMRTQPIAFGEVVIEGKAPISQQGDTLVYDVTSFRDGSEEVIEDVLRKLPGIEVDEEGTIRFQGRTVSKVKIDNDDLFDENYAILTKNLTPDVIENVEVLQNYSDNPLLKGVEDSDEVALNLTLREDARRVLFGNVRGGSNFQDRHEAKLNLVSFLGKSKFYGLGAFNSLGEDPVGDVQNLTRPNQGGGNTLGNGINSADFVPYAYPQLPFFFRNRYYFNQAGLGSISSIFNPAENLKVKLVGYYLRDRNQYESSSSIDFFVEDSLFQQYRERQSTDLYTQTGVVQTSITYQAGARLNVQYDGEVSLGEVAEQRNFVFNGNPLDQQTTTNFTYHNHFLNSVYRVSETGAFSVDLRYLADRRPQTMVATQNLFLEGPSAEESLRQEVNQPVDFIGAEAKYFQKMGNNLLTVRGGYGKTRYQWGYSLQAADSLVGTQPWNLQLDRVYVEGRFKYNTGALSMTPTLRVTHLGVASLGISQFQGFLLSPQLGIVWKQTDESILSGAFGYDYGLPEPELLVPNRVLQGYNAAREGATSYQPIGRPIALVNYRYGGWGDRFTINGTFFWQSGRSEYLYRQELRPTYTVQAWDGFQNTDLTSVSVNMDRFLKKLSSAVKLSYSYSNYAFTSAIQESTLPTQVQSHKVDLSLRSAFLGFFNFHVGVKGQYDLSNSGDQFAANNYFSQVYADGYFTFKKLRASWKAETYQLWTVPEQPLFYFLDFDVSYQALPNKLKVYAKAKNLFNEDTFVIRSISNQQIQTQSSQLIPRYILLGLEFRF